MNKTASIAGAAGILGAALVGAWATTGNASPDAPAPRAAHAASQWNLDSVHSSVQFRIMHLGITPFLGEFDEVRGEFTLDPDNITNGSISIEIPIESIDTSNETRNGHLLASDFFNGRQFPLIRFESTGITRKSGNNYALEGNLTLHGETHPVTADMTYYGTAEMRGTQKVGFGATFTIDRTKFGLTKWDGILGNEVTIEVGIQGNAS